jgi:hypothetical protein
MPFKDPLYDVIQFHVVVKKTIGKTDVGSVWFPIFLVTARHAPPSRVVQWWPLRKNAADRTARGALLLDIGINVGNAAPPPVISLLRDATAPALPLSVRVIEAVNLYLDDAVGPDGVADLQAAVGVGSAKNVKSEVRTEVRRKTQFPVWNELFEFECNDIAESVRIQLTANGKFIGRTTVPLVFLFAMRDNSGKAVALDFWWPLLAKNAHIQPQNKHQHGLLHVAIYLGGSSNQVHRVAEQPVSILRQGWAKKSNSKDGWDTRFLVLRTGGHMPAHLSVYKSESDAKKDTNGTTIALLGARLPDKLDIAKKHVGRVLCVRECIAKMTKPRTFLFDSVAEHDEWRAQLVAARRVPLNWFDSRLVGSVENQPKYAMIDEKVPVAATMHLPFLQISDENDDEGLFAQSKFIVEARGDAVGDDVDADSEYGSVGLGTPADDERNALPGSGYGQLPQSSGYDQVPGVAGYDQVPGVLGYGQVPNSLGYGAPPAALRGEGYGAPPATLRGEGYGAPPAEASSGYGAAPPALATNAGYGSVPPAAMSGYGQVPQGDGYAKAPPPSALEPEKDKKGKKKK